MKKIIFGIFICLFANFLMSHNSGALGDYIPVTDIGRFKVSLTTNFDGSDNCSTLNPDYRRWIYTDWDSATMGADQYYLMSISFLNAAGNNSFDGRLPIAVRSGFENSFTIVDVEVSNVSPSQSVMYLVLHRKNNTLPTGTFPIQIFTQEDYFVLFQNECVSNGGWLTKIKWNEQASLPNYTNQLNSINSSIQQILNTPQVTPQQINDVNNKLDDLNTSVENRNRAEFDSVDNINNQTPSDISDSTDQHTTNLMGIFSSFVSAVTAAGATNCNIVANWGHLNLGTLNLCRDQPPAFVSVIGSIVLIVILVPCAYWLVMRILAEIRSFTNG